MLKTRVIPTLLWKGANLVKGVSFDSWRPIGSVLPALKVYNARDVDELMLLDITATAEERDPKYNAISELSMESFVPLTVGGGIDSVEKIRKLLFVGADKVCINSAAYKNPNIIREGAERFGSQCIVASLDVRKLSSGKYECYSHCSTRPTGKEPHLWARELEKLGAGEILLTSIELDGTMKGYDVDLIKKVSDSVAIPVIASGGAGNYQHMLEVVKTGEASAVAAASIYHFTQQTPGEAKLFLLQNGIPVRNSNIRSFKQA